jgi:peptidoglycan-associated lipoprotein
MTFRQVSTLALAALTLGLGACKKRTPADTSAPTPVTDDAAARERARADSIAAAEAAREREARARAAEMARARESLTDRIHFDYDSEQLSPEAEERLRVKAAILRANPGVQVRVEGHADERGSTEYNLALGQRRAESVRTFLTGYGIDAGRISTLSYGKERPLIDESTEAAWAQNRRAEFAITTGDVSTVPPEVR